MSFPPQAGPRAVRGAATANWRLLPAALDARRGGVPSGSFIVAMPSTAKELAERRRDFARTMASEGIGVLTPTFCDDIQRRLDRRSSVLGMVVEAKAGDVGDVAVREAVGDFCEQLQEATEDIVSVCPKREAFREAVLSGRVISQLTIGPALDFALSVGLPPRLLQPRFVVVVGPNVLRVATLAFVGEPLIGDKPSEQRTPFLVRLLTDDLLEPGDNAHLRTSYTVRSCEVHETTINDCYQSEVDSLLIAVHKPVVEAPQEALAPEVRFAGVRVPGWFTREEVTLFRVEVSPVGDLPLWNISRRYQQFHDFYSSIRPQLGELAVACFPRKTFRPCAGPKLEERRRSLEVWLNELVRQAQSREPWLMQHLCAFFDFETHTAPPPADLSDASRWSRRAARELGAPPGGLAPDAAALGFEATPAPGSPGAEPPAGPSLAPAPPDLDLATAQASATTPAPPVPVLAASPQSAAAHAPVLTDLDRVAAAPAAATTRAPSDPDQAAAAQGVAATTGDAAGGSPLAAVQLGEPADAEVAELERPRAGAGVPPQGAPRGRVAEALLCEAMPEPGLPALEAASSEPPACTALPAPGAGH